MKFIDSLFNRKTGRQSYLGKHPILILLIILLSSASIVISYIPRLSFLLLPILPIVRYLAVPLLLVRSLALIIGSPILGVVGWIFFDNDSIERLVEIILIIGGLILILDKVLKRK